MRHGGALEILLVHSFCFLELLKEAIYARHVLRLLSIRMVTRLARLQRWPCWSPEAALAFEKRREGAFLTAAHTGSSAVLRLRANST